jgi:hypothetical protein
MTGLADRYEILFVPVLDLSVSMMDARRDGSASLTSRMPDEMFCSSFPPARPISTPASRGPDDCNLILLMMDAIPSRRTD